MAGGAYQQRVWASVLDAGGRALSLGNIVYFSLSFWFKCSCVGKNRRHTVREGASELWGSVAPPLHTGAPDLGL